MKGLLLGVVFCFSLPTFAASEFQTGLQAYRTQDYGKALAAFFASAEAGDPRAAQLLADIYATGRGVVANPGLALQWRLRAADLGDPGAQYIVGMQYLQGSGVPRDPNQAAYWLERSARQNHPNAALELGLLQLEGRGDPASGIAWIRQAADQGLFDAQQVLADVYRQGQAGVPRNAEAASGWAETAKRNAETGQQINRSIVEQQNAIAVARNAYYYAPRYAYPWVYPTWGVGWGRYSGSTRHSGWSRYGGWNYGVGVGGVWW